MSGCLYPRPTELTRLGPGHNLVEASAGTGKTFLLEHLFVDLVLEHGVPAEEIMVVTFTEKATAELVLRLRRLLGELAELRPDHPKARAAQAAPAGPAWLIDDRARALLRRALLAFDRVGVSTIHAFCERVLREHAFVQGRLFDEELAGGEATFAAAFHEILRTRVASDGELGLLVEGWLDGGQTVADLQALLVECARAKAQALCPQLDEDRLAAALRAWRPIAANDRALANLFARANIRKDVGARCCGRLAVISRQVADGTGAGLRFLCALHAAGDDHLGYVLAKLEGKPLDAELAETRARLAELRAAAVPLAAVLAGKLLPLVQAQAARRKRAAGRFDFDDMLVLVERALADPGPAGRALIASLRARYRHALIDEFQDTDDVQWSIFRRIFVEAGDHHGLTVIGDPKQAIYAFRGANVETYLAARASLWSSGAPHVVLERNFRSTADFVAATNLIFDQAAGFFPPDGGIAYDQPVSCGQPALALSEEGGKPAPPVVALGLETKGQSLRADDARAVLTATIVRELDELLAAGSSVRLHDAAGARRPRPRDVFILTFTNTESWAIGRALARARIPHAFYKQEHLFATAEAAEILDVLRALCAPEDPGRRARALLTRFFGLELAEVAAGGPGSEPARLLAGLAARSRRGDIPSLFSALLDETAVLRRELYAGGGERALTNFMHVFELLQAQWARTGAGLPELVERLDAFVRGTETPPGRDADVQRLETDANAVQILTVHKAKGLEAGIVFLYGGLGEQNHRPVRVVHRDGRRLACVGPLDDATRRRFQTEQWSEHCRLLYVAVTRARYRLYLPHFPAQLTRLDGPYRPMNQRLDAILGGPPCPLVERRPVDCDAPAPAPANPAAVANAAAVPDPGLLEIPSVPADVVAIRRQRSGFLVTSYTGVKHARAALAAAKTTGDLPSPETPLAEPPRDPDALPGGAETGIFLHEILARVSLDELAAGPALADWRIRPVVVELCERQRRRCGRPASELEPAARLVHLAYTTAIDLGGGIVTPLAAVRPALREMEFLYPMPESAQPLLGAAAATTGAAERRWRIDRGAVKGFIDFLFEHEGRVFVCDWKSDVLPDYATAALDEHCREHYDVQARLYTLAVLRMCGIADRSTFARRFGGMIFCFLRGLGPSGEGIVRRMPSWDELLAWEREMLGQTFWGLA